MSFAEIEVWINPYSVCPNCGSNLIDYYDERSGCFRCAKCGAWYSEDGEPIFMDDSEFN